MPGRRPCLPAPSRHDADSPRRVTATEHIVAGCRPVSRCSASCRASSRAASSVRSTTYNSRTRCAVRARRPSGAGCSCYGSRSAGTCQVWFGTGSAHSLSGQAKQEHPLLSRPEWCFSKFPRGGHLSHALAALGVPVLVAGRTGFERTRLLIACRQDGQSQPEPGTAGPPAAGIRRSGDPLECRFPHGDAGLARSPGKAVAHGSRHYPPGDAHHRRSDGQVRLVHRLAIRRAKGVVGLTRPHPLSSASPPAVWRSA